MNESSAVSNTAMTRCPYTLTLTRAEIEAFDWVGSRYAAGEIADLLRDACHAEPDSPDWHAWFDRHVPEVTFHVPEHIAWEIHHLAEEEDFAFPCFAPELTAKLQDFCFGIV